MVSGRSPFVALKGMKSEFPRDRPDGLVKNRVAYCLYIPASPMLGCEVFCENFFLDILFDRTH
jgi:hypothetical protein